MKDCTANGRASAASKLVIGGMFVLTAVLTVLFNEVTPAMMLFI